jgi:hypothetical protein
MIRLASTPVPHVTSVAHSVLDLFRINGEPQTMHRPIPAPEPNPEPNPGPDAVWQHSQGNITSADWDSLFLAVLARLENCVSDHPIPAQQLPLYDPRVVVRATVLECVSALQQLHVALSHERQLNSGL